MDLKRQLEEAAKHAKDFAEELRKDMEAQKESHEAELKRANDNVLLAKAETETLRPSAQKWEEQEVERKRQEAERFQKESEAIKNKMDEYARKHVEEREQALTEAKADVKEWKRKDAEAKSNLSKAKADLEAAQTRIDALTKEGSQNSEAMATLRTEKTELDKQHKALIEEESATAAKLKDAQETESKLRVKIENLKEELAKTRTDLEQLQTRNKALEIKDQITIGLPPGVQRPGMIKLSPKLQESADYCKEWLTKYRLGLISGNTDANWDEKIVFNQLPTLPYNIHLKTITVHYLWGLIAGIEVTLTNNETFATGSTDSKRRGYDGKTSKTLEMHERVVKCEIQGGLWVSEGTTQVHTICLGTNKGRVLEWKKANKALTDHNGWTEFAPEGGFALQGFWGQYGKAINRLGPVWMKEKD